MKYLKSYNESVRDLMKPKSREEIENKIGDLTSMDKILKGCSQGAVWLVQQGMEEGAGIRFSGDFPLSLAIVKGHKDVVQFLLDNGSIVHKDMLESDEESLNIEISHLVKQYYDKQRSKYVKSNEKRFIIDKKNYKFQLFLEDILVAESHFSIEQPDELFNQKYVGLFKLETNKEFRGKGFMKYLLGQIFDYVKNELNIINILLNVYKNNDSALNLYFNSGFEIYKNYDDDDEPYFTLIKKLYPYDKFLSESNQKMTSVRDLMTPKSEEDIKIALSKLDPNAKLIVGCRDGFLWVVKEALAEGADIRVGHNTPFIWACRRGYVDIVKFLLDKEETEINATNGSPLKYACQGGHIEIIKLLLNNGADADLVDKILKSKYNEIVKLLNPYRKKKIKS